MGDGTKAASRQSSPTTCITAETRSIAVGFSEYRVEGGEERERGNAETGRQDGGDHVSARRYPRRILHTPSDNSNCPSATGPLHDPGRNDDDPESPLPNINPCAAISKIILLNGRSISPSAAGNTRWKLPFIESVLLRDTNSPPSIALAISESWLKPYISDAQIQIQGYNSFRSDRPERKGGGCVLYVQEQIPISYAYSFSDRECSLVLAYSEAQNIIFSCIYRPPEASDQSFNSIMNDLQQKIGIVSNGRCPEMYIMGDLNLPQYDWESNCPKKAVSQNGAYQRTVEFVDENFLTQVVDQPTREKNILDVILTNSPQYIAAITTEDTKISDHRVVNCALAFNPLAASRQSSPTTCITAETRSIAVGFSEYRVEGGEERERGNAETGRQDGGDHVSARRYPRRILHTPSDNSSCPPATGPLHDPGRNDDDPESPLPNINPCAAISKIILLNGRSISPSAAGNTRWKLPFIESVLLRDTNSPPSIALAISESWLKPYISDAQIQIQGYNTYRSDRPERKGGGCVLYVHEQIPISYAYSFSDRECSLVLAYSEAQNIIFSCIYRPPEASDQSFNSIMNDLQQKIGIVSNGRCPEMYIMGDLNLPQYDWESNCPKKAVSQNGAYQRTVEFVDENFLTQVVDQPTRENNILDVILTNSPQYIAAITTEDTKISDHRVVNCALAFNPLVEKPPQTTSWDHMSFRGLNLHKADFERGSLGGGLGQSTKGLLDPYEPLSCFGLSCSTI
eukprot:sb/3462420/